jgi:hypothetical protein
MRGCPEPFATAGVTAGVDELGCQALPGYLDRGRRSGVLSGYRLFTVNDWESAGSARCCPTDPATKSVVTQGK